MASEAVYDAAIVGGGACGLATLLQLLEKAPMGFRVALVEKNMSAGPGLAYSEACAGTHVNMHASTMSVYANDPNHFVRWMDGKPCESKKRDFPRREYYGKYLSELSADATQIAEDRGVELTMFKNEVLDVWPQSLGWAVHLSNGTVIEASKVALALGNFTSTIHKHLKGKPLYFERPWPNYQLLSIPKNASVCIVGSRLTAIDEALYLAENGHVGPITLISRTGQLPKVQADSRKYERFFALDNLARELEDDHSGGIITIAKRIHDEVRRSRKGKWFLSHETDDVVSQFRLDVEHAREGDVPGQDVLRATAPVIERYWKCLDEESRKAFLREFMSEWVIHRHAMPLHTAEKVLRILESGQLRVKCAEPGASVRWENDQFRVPLIPKDTLQVDALIEATGLEYDATKVDTPLMRNLLSRETLKPHHAGGVHVDFNTLEAQKGLYVLGSMTRGVHFYSTAIDRNVAHAERLADSMVGLPQRRSLHVALFAGSDLFSQLMVSQLVPRLLASGHVPYIYLPVHKASKKSQLFQLREMGFFERGLLQDHVIPYLGDDLDKAGPCMTPQQLRARYGVLVESVPDVNNSDFVQSLKSNHIDLGYSIRCYHRFKTDIISFFQSRQGLWNLHPGVLPAYRGVMTTVRAMANKEENFGYSMHQINEDWDAGALVDIREHPIDYSKPMLNYMDDVWNIGVDMADDMTEKIARGQVPESIPQDEEKKGYYTFPTKAELMEYDEQGLKLVDGEGIKKTLIQSFAPENGDKELSNIIEKACTAWYDENSA